MNRSLALLGVVLLLAAGCGGGGEKKSSGTTTGGQNAGEGMKIGLVTDVGGLNDRGFNHLSFVGLQRAESELGVMQRVFQAHSTVVYVDQTEEPHKPPNLLGLLFREQETGYLVGYLGGLEEKRRAGPDVIGSVGGQKQPPVDRFIAGYQAGAKAADPGIKLLNGYSEDWADQAKCKQIALNQIEQGAGVIFQVAGGCGLGALDAAKEKGVLGLGVDADQSFLGSHILTSAVKRVDTAVFLAIKSVVDGKFKGGNMVFGLKDNGVGIGKISSRVPKSEVAAVNKVRADIISGKIKNIPTEVP